MSQTVSAEDAHTALTCILAEAQADMRNPKKDKQGQTGQQRYMYATLDGVLDIVRPPLNSRGVFLSQHSEESDAGRMMLVTSVSYMGETRVLDCKPYEYDAEPKEYGKRETYARRYSLLCAFGLAGEDDDDGNVAPKRQRKAEPDRRTKVAAAIAGLKAACMQRGVPEEELDAWAEANVGTADVQAMGEEQMTAYGKWLRRVSEEGK